MGKWRIQKIKIQTKNSVREFTGEKFLEIFRIVYSPP
jgi:hypothetical protein